MNLLATFGNFFRGPDLFIVAAIVVLLFGGKKLPQLVRAVRRSIDEFKAGKAEDSVVLPEEPREQEDGGRPSE